MRPGALIQARMGSTRLPGKVLAPLEGKPLLLRILERLRAAEGLACLAVATSAAARDDAVAALCAEHGIPCHRGPEDDVLRRTLDAALAFELDPVVRITGDCPFVCPRAVSELLAFHRREDADYSTYSEETVHEGIDPFSLRWLRAAQGEARAADEREHPLLILRRRPGAARIARLRPDPRLRARPGLRLSVDEPADLEFARAVYAALGAGGRLFSTEELLALLEQRPELAAGNRHVARRVPKGIA